MVSHAAHSFQSDFRDVTTILVVGQEKQENTQK